MPRSVFRPGFSLQRTQSGVGHLTDLRTRDALLIPAPQVALLMTAGTGGLDHDAVGATELLERFGAFLVAAPEAPAPRQASFAELDLRDAPGGSEEIDDGRHLKEALEASAALQAISRATAHEEPTPEAVLEQMEEPEPATEELPLPPKPDSAASLLSEEENLRQALHGHEAQVAFFSANPPAQETEARPPSAPVAAPSSTLENIPALVPNRRPIALTAIGITLLVLSVVVSFVLRPSAESMPVPQELPQPNTPTAPDAGVPLETLRADLPVQPVAPAPRAAETGKKPWRELAVQAKGRVKMGTTPAPAEGLLTWTVESGQRVKAKQEVGTITPPTGSPHPVEVNAVGLVMPKQPSGSKVKKGANLADIVYFEAWGRAPVRGVVPQDSWRCEVASASAAQRADCRISVVTARQGGAQVTFTVEPMWFDESTDAVLRLAPP